MRIKIEFEGKDKVMPIGNQHLVNGFIHKCLGADNVYHDTPSDYSISMLHGGKLLEPGKLIYKNTAFIVATGPDKFMSDLVMGLMKEPSFNDMPLKNITPIKEQFFNGINHFATLSPIMIQKYVNNKKVFSKLEDVDYESRLTEHVKRKILKLLPGADTSAIRILVTKNGGKSGVIMIRNVKNIANTHHLSITCNANIAELLYTTGIGQSTGSGFGTIYKTGNKHLYFKN